MQLPYEPYPAPPGYFWHSAKSPLQALADWQNGLGAPNDLRLIRKLPDPTEPRIVFIVFVEDHPGTTLPSAHLTRWQTLKRWVRRLQECIG